MRFIKLLNLEEKQNELLFKVKAELIYNSIYPLFRKEKDKKNTDVKIGKN